MTELRRRVTDLEIKPEEVQHVNRGVHTRLTNMAPTNDTANDLKAILTELRVIKNHLSRLLPRVGAALVDVVDAKATIKMRDILTCTAVHFGITELDLLSIHREHTILRPRQIAMYLCRTMTPRSYSQIARFFSDRDHTTIMHAVNCVIGLMQQDARMAMDIKVLTETILTGKPKGDHDES
jgi:chromosomal replication initiation ATPase DnaA